MRGQGPKVRQALRRLVRARRPGVRLVAAALLAVAIAAALLHQAGDDAAHGHGLPASGRVTEVYDGDTVQVTADGAEYKVRLIGVDTPEAWPSDKLTRDAQRTEQDAETIMALGRRASAFTRSLCLGNPCRLEYDPANTATGHRDRYGRLLAFVHVPAEGGGEVLVNAAILREGYGRAFIRYPFDEARKAEFVRLERAARGAGRGLWGEEDARF